MSQTQKMPKEREVLEQAWKNDFLNIALAVNLLLEEEDREELARLAAAGNINRNIHPSKSDFWIKVKAIFKHYEGSLSINSEVYPGKNEVFNKALASLNKLGYLDKIFEVSNEPPSIISMKFFQDQAVVLFLNEDTRKDFLRENQTYFNDENNFFHLKSIKSVEPDSSIQKLIQPFKHHRFKHFESAYEAERNKFWGKWALGGLRTLIWGGRPVEPGNGSAKREQGSVRREHLGLIQRELDQFNFFLRNLEKHQSVGDLLAFKKAAEKLSKTLDRIQGEMNIDQKKKNSADKLGESSFKKLIKTMAHQLSKTIEEAKKALLKSEGLEGVQSRRTPQET